MNKLVLHEYSQGVAYDGAVILCDGAPLTIEEILSKLRALEDVRAMLHGCPELNPSNYDHDQVCDLNSAVCEAWSRIESDS